MYACVLLLCLALLAASTFYAKKKIKEKKRSPWWDTWCVYCFLRNQNPLLGCFLCACVKSARKRDPDLNKPISMGRFILLSLSDIHVRHFLSVFPFASYLVTFPLLSRSLFLAFCLAIFCSGQSTVQKTQQETEIKNLKMFNW